MENVPKFTSVETQTGKRDEFNVPITERILTPEAAAEANRKADKAKQEQKEAWDKLQKEAQKKGGM